MRRLFRKFFFIVVSLLVAIVVVDIAFVLGIPKENLPKSTADAVVVLGAAPNSPAIQNRTKKGIEIFRADKAQELILSGGKTDERDESEAQNMKKYVAKQDPSVDVVLEGESENTWANLRNTRKLVPDAKSIIVVTDQYHLARSFFVAKAVGFGDVYWSSPPSHYYPEKELRFYYFREMTALPWYAWRWLVQ